MASGDPIDSGRAVATAYWASHKLLEAVGAVNDGVWIDVRGFKRMSVHISGITTATVQIRGSNAVAKPANSSHEVQIGSDITANSVVNLDVPVRWIKAMVSAFTSGSISANLQLVTEG